MVGPESSGTKLTAELLRRAGCRSVAMVGGDDGEPSPLDGHPPLVRRSFPHGRCWPVVRDLVAELGVPDVQAVVTSRDWFTMADSQVNRRLVADQAMAIAHIRRAYQEIFAGLAELGLSFVVSSFEAFTAQPAYAVRLLNVLGLPAASVATYDANSKWYEGVSATTGPPPRAWTAGQPDPAPRADPVRLAAS